MPNDELIAALEKADGPDRGLDWWIAEALGEVPEHVIQGPVGTPYGWFRREGQWSLTRTKESDVYAGVESWSPKPRTASIDAALTLVPEGMRCRFLIYENGRAGAQLWWPPEDLPDAWGKAYATPALAIVIAALRAAQRGEAGR